MVNITSENFSKNTSGNLFAVFFGTPWCGPCKSLKPLLENIFSRRDDISVGYVDCDSESELAYDYEIRSVPAVKFFRDGKIVHELSGSKTKIEIEKIIEEQVV